MKRARQTSRNGMGRGVIVDAFFRWAEGAKSDDRARAANALGRAYLQSAMSPDERQAAEIAMAYLLDDPAQRVRIALAEALAPSPDAPRSVILSLAADLPEVACNVLTCSPLLLEADLVDLAIRGTEATRMMIAARPCLSRAVGAAIAEIGEENAILCLLENRSASLASISLTRIAERFGDTTDIRDCLLARADLPTEARYLLAVHVSSVLMQMPLVQAALCTERFCEVSRDALEASACAIANEVEPQKLPALVGYMQETQRLTPSFLLRALCGGRAEIFSAAIVVLTGYEERRVRSIIANGRRHAVRALYETAGLARDMSEVFVEATLLWREASRDGTDAMIVNVTKKLIALFDRPHGSQDVVRHGLVEFIERLHIAEERSWARHYASSRMLAAA